MTSDEARSWEGFKDLQRRYAPDIRRMEYILSETLRDGDAPVFVVAVTTADYPVFRFGRILASSTRRHFRQYGIRWKNWYPGEGSPPMCEETEKGWAEVGRWEPSKRGMATQEQERLGRKDYQDRVWKQVRYG